MALESIKECLDPFTGSLLSPILIPRMPGTENATKVREFIGSHFSTLGWQVSNEEFTAVTPRGELEMANILVKNPRHKSPKFTLSAHYDSKIEPEGFIGAIDSAVPCALLMYIATALQNYDLDIDFRFFDGEEAIDYWTDTDSIYGARHHAGEDNGINFLVLLDLIGGESGPIPSWFEETFPVFQRLEAINLELGQAGQLKYRLLGGDAHQHSGQMLDDHIPFWQKGVPCLHLIPAQFPPVWHTIDDDAKHLSLPFIHDWAVLLVEWLKRDLVVGHDEL